MRVNKSSIPIVVLLVLALALLILYRPWAGDKVGVLIPRGMTGRQVAQRLYEKGIIVHPWEFIAAGKLLGREKQVMAGFYTFRKRTPALFLFDILNRGSNEHLSLTVPEGYNLQDIGHLFQTREIMDSQEFDQLMTDQGLIRELGVEDASLEGYLFPDTYYFDPIYDKKEIIRMMVRNFFQNVKDLNLGDSLRPILIMASIIEKEARLDRERPIIASVFRNRLRIHRPIESCATVLYVLGWTKKRLTDADLTVKSPYNTYQNPGLPPGPICSPGIKSLAAAARPAQTDFLYFVSKGDGSHIFSKTYQEHVVAKAAVSQNGKR